MIQQPHFPYLPWSLEETELDLDLLPQTESLFALSNGHIGLRGNLDEGEPNGMPGTYLNSVHDLRPLPYAEGGYGYPVSGQTVCNVTNGKLFRLLVDDETFDVRYGKLKNHHRKLDFQAGTLERTCEWTSPSGHSIRLRTTRMVSLTARSIAVFSYEVEALDQPVRIVVQSEMVANEQMPALAADPRVASVLESPLEAEEHFCRENSALLVHHTKRTDTRIAATMDHTVEGTKHLRTECMAMPNLARFTVTDLLHPGDKVRIIKYLAYGWSVNRSLHALRSQVKAALTSARQLGFDQLLEEQRRYLHEFWSHADVEMADAPDLQQAVRFALFHLLQASARAELRAIPAKGLTGSGYDGHSFWDTEAFVLPVLLHTIPKAAGDALRWRHSIMPTAVEHARELNLKGAAFPWRTIHGEECSGYWPAGTAAFHVNADIADACARYVKATDDAAFEVEVALPILVQTARLWRSLGAFDRHGNFRIDGVTGPDEYSALADNNIYTNVMARRNLRGAVEVCRKYPELSEAFHVSEAELDEWTRAAEHVLIPFDKELGVHMQDDTFTSHAQWDFAATKSDQYPLLLHFPYFDLYRKQVVKQADLVLAMVVDSSAFTDEQKARNFDYYERITVRDSSLSAATQAIVAAEVGHLDLAYAYLRETSFMDLEDLERNTRDGLHLASLAGIWSVLVAGFGGMRDCSRVIHFHPRLPTQISRLRFRLRRNGRKLEVEMADGHVTYRLLDGAPLAFEHDGEKLTLGKEAVVRALMPASNLPAPTQPAGREPLAKPR